LSLHRSGRRHSTEAAAVCHYAVRHRRRRHRLVPLRHARRAQYQDLFTHTTPSQRGAGASVDPKQYTEFTNSIYQIYYSSR
jgi:hypothetical protein